MKRSFRLITILGIPIEINYTWFITFFLVVYTLATFQFPLLTPGLKPLTYWLMGLICGLLLFVCLLMHELSHSFVAKMNKLNIMGITLFIFGGVAHIEKEPANPGVEFKMAIAGPLMSFFLGFSFWLITTLFLFLNFSKGFYVISGYLSFFNFIVAIFNLIPGFPLDGGRILRSAIWHFSGDLRRATLIASSFGKGFAYFMIALGFLEMFRGFLLAGAWLIFLGLFLMEAAETSYKQMVMKKVLSGIKIEKLISKNVVTVPAAIALDRLVDDYFFKYRFTSFPVTEDDTLLGLITFHKIKEVKKEEWGSTTAKDILIPISDDLLAKKDEDLFDAMAKIAHNNVGRLLIIEDSPPEFPSLPAGGGSPSMKKLIGILSQKDVIRFFKFKEEIGE